ncbi:unnamed protein product [Orchesella dallaii]|uniref:Uncharacterized protein n=1 Tax=Orchesella dallaii TaxID=48710 RepID=A0ABP1QLL4_9HEXA
MVDQQIYKYAVSLKDGLPKRASVTQLMHCALNTRSLYTLSIFLFGKLINAWCIKRRNLYMYGNLLETGNQPKATEQKLFVRFHYPKKILQSNKKMKNRPPNLSLIPN